MLIAYQRQLANYTAIVNKDRNHLSYLSNEEIDKLLEKGISDEEIDELSEKYKNEYFRHGYRVEKELEKLKEVNKTKNNK